MVEIYSICGKWKQNDKSQWKFVVDTNRLGSLSEIDENVTYKDLVEMVIEDLGIDGEDIITLSYELPPRMKSMVQNPPPVDIRNDRQLRTFINMIKENNQLFRLCVTVNDKSNMIAVENVGTNIQSKTIHSGENCDVERHTDIVLQNLDGHSYVDESSKHEKQQELHRSIGSNVSDSVAHNDRYEYGYSTRESDGLHVNQRFNNKQELMFKMRKWAVEWKFEFRSLLSDKTRVVLVCMDDTCRWRMRATKLDSSDVFVVKRYDHEHTCDTTGKSVKHKQATAKLVGTLICNNNGELKDGLTPKQIIEQVRKEHGIEITYGKARRAKELVQYLMRETPGSETEISFSPPCNKESNGGSTRKRKRSAGGSYKCSRCGREGHNKNTCEISTDVEEGRHGTADVEEESTAKIPHIGSVC